MGRALTAAAVIALTIITAFPEAGWCLDKGNLYNMFRSRAAVKTSVSDITDSTDENKVDAAGLKENLEEALTARKSINFELVENEKDADIIIDCEVTKYFWSERDPIDMIFSTGAIAMDAIMVENYAYLEAAFKITDARKGKLLWKKELKIDLTRKKMNEQESLSLINEKTARIFIRDCFSKGRSKPRGMF